MATVQQLISELTNLISQTKRRNVDLRTAAEKTLDLLRTYPSGSDESKFLRGLSKSPELIRPFIIACSTRNAKYCASAVQCLHILLANRAVPIKQLSEVVDALDEATHLGVEIQLKILQTLPLFIQSYGDNLHGKLLVDLLQVCYSLQTGNKIAVVINTAAATLQQIVVSLFDRVVEEDQLKSNGTDKTITTVPIDGNQHTEVLPCAYDAVMIFTDLCNLAEKMPPKFLKFSHLQDSFTLELLESILTNHSSMFINHVELGFILRTRVVPLLLRAFSESRGFDVTVRVTRILYLLVRREIPVLQVECEVILSLLTHMLSSDDEPYWKQVLCMEVFQGIFNEFDLVLILFEQYDNDSSKRPIVGGIVEALSKTIEKSASKIGIVPDSVPHILTSGNRTPENEGDRDPSSDENYAPGITTDRSTVRVPCIDLLDKAEAPRFPETYVPYLVLDCLNYLSDGLAKTLSTLAHQSDASNVTDEKPKRRLPLQPDGEKSTTLRLFIESCWKPMFKAYTVLFLAPMDLDLCHSLIRGAQRFCHSSGVLGADSPRDSFLRLLGMFSIYGGSSLNRLKSIAAIDSTTQIPGAGGSLNMETFLGSLINPLQSAAKNSGNMHNAPGTNPGTRGVTSGNNEVANNRDFRLNQRSILCCRALLNLATALGPVLENSWLTIFETLQCFDSLANSGIDRVLLFGDFPFFSRSKPELSVIDTSIKKLLDYTKELDEKSFFFLLKAVCQVSCLTLSIDPIEKIELSQASSFALGNDLSREDPNFLLCFLGELTAINVPRFANPKEQLGIWNFLGRYFLSVIESKNVSTEPKIIASTILNNTIVLTAVECGNLQRKDGIIDEKPVRASVEIQREVISTLYTEVCGEYTSSDVNILVSSLDTLKTILDQSGSRLGNSWDVVFSIISIVFKYDTEKGDSARLKNQDVARLIRSGFDSMQLICNDFLENLPKDCMCRLIETLYNFCEQDNDLNISFTSISNFWLVSDHLRGSVSDSKFDLPQPFANTEEIEAAAEATASGEPSDKKLLCLWLIVLLRLTAIVSDTRPQVRNGAVITLFRIFETYGHQMPGNIWQTCHDVILPRIMTANCGEEVTAEFVETVSLILEGFSTTYSMFLPRFIKNSPDFSKVWHALLEYCNLLIRIKNSEISACVYSCLHTILNGLKSNMGFVRLPNNCLEEVWAFWISQEVPTEVSDAKSAQECLKLMVYIHGPLREISLPDISWENTQGSIKLLGKCASFKLLPPFYSDMERTSPLQEAALAQLKRINTTSIKVLSLLLKTFSGLSMLCVANSKDTKAVACSEPNSKVPTFIELSYESLLYLDSKLLPSLISDEYFEPLLLHDNGTVEYVLKRITSIASNKYDCPWVTQPGSAQARQLWEIANTVFLQVVGKAAVFLTKESPASAELTELVLIGMESILSYKGLNSLENRDGGSGLASAFESSDIATYKTFMGLIDPDVHSGIFPSSFWDSLIKSLFNFSLLAGLSIDIDFENLSASTQKIISSVSFGTIRKSTALPRRLMAYHCFGELFRLSLSRDATVSSISTRYLTARGAILLRSYLTNRPLRGKAPLPVLQRQELAYFFKTLLDFENKNKGFGYDLRLLEPLLVKCIPIASTDNHFLCLIEDLMLRFSHVST